VRRVAGSPAGLGLVALLAITAIAAPGFYAAANLRDVILTNAPVLIAAIGMTLVILLGEIDISIGAQFAVCSVVAGLLAKSGMGMAGAAIGAALAGGLLGALNGLLVARFRIPSIVVTLATMMAIRDALRWTTEGAWVQNLPASFQWAGVGQSAGWWLIVASSLATFSAFSWALRNLAAGRAVYATGCAPEAARLAGLSPRGVVFSVFVISGILTGVAALLSSIRFSDIQSNTGVGLEMKVIAAVVVGGASISGGRGTLGGTLLGVALLGVIGTALTFLGVNPYWEKAAQGAIILVGVISDAWARTEKHGVIAAAVH
jgi:rhamnose transport system permease protein